MVISNNEELLEVFTALLDGLGSNVMMSCSDWYRSENASHGRQTSVKSTLFQNLGRVVDLMAKPQMLLLNCKLHVTGLCQRLSLAQTHDYCDHPAICSGLFPRGFRFHTDAGFVS